MKESENGVCLAAIKQNEFDVQNEVSLKILLQTVLAVAVDDGVPRPLDRPQNLLPAILDDFVVNLEAPAIWTQSKPLDEVPLDP